MLFYGNDINFVVRLELCYFRLIIFATNVNYVLKPLTIDFREQQRYSFRSGR